MIPWRPQAALASSVRVVTGVCHVPPLMSRDKNVVFSYLVEAETFLYRDGLSRVLLVQHLAFHMCPCLTRAPRPILRYGWFDPLLSLEVRASALTTGT